VGFPKQAATAGLEAELVELVRRWTAIHAVSESFKHFQADSKDFSGPPPER
jgi:hypothetical protein